MLALAIDPGLSTGIAWFHNEELIRQETIYRGLDGWLDWYYAHKWPGRPDRVIHEDYISDGSTTGRVWSSEIIGAIRALDWGGVKIIRQLRSDKATLFGQKFKGEAGEQERFEWLRARGFDGTDHELDAITHALVDMKKRKNSAALERYWFQGASPIAIQEK